MERVLIWKTRFLKNANSLKPLPTAKKDAIIAAITMRWWKSSLNWGFYAGKRGRYPLFRVS